MSRAGAVVLVTGGGSGIGRATARLLSRKGMRVAVSGRRAEPLEAVVAEIRAAGGEALAVTGDLRDAGDVERVVESVARELGPIETLVNNAGLAIVKPAWEMTPEEWDTTLETNLKSAFLCARAVLPSMLEAQRGSIVNVASTLGKQGIANHAAYCASKFGLVGLTESLAAEVQGRGVRVWAVCPGATDTPLHQSLVGAEQAARTMRPETVAEVIAGVLAGEVVLQSGGAIVVDDQPGVTRKQRGPLGRGLRRIRKSLSARGE